MAKKKKQPLPPPEASSSSEDEEGSDDSSINSDEAFDSEDEKKYGDYFANFKKPGDNNHDDNSGEEDDSSEGEGEEVTSDEEDSEEDDDEGDAAGYMVDLMDQMNPTDPAALDSSISHNDNNTKSKVTFQKLLSNLTDTNNYVTLQKDIATLSNAQTTAPKAAAVVTARAERKVQYKEAVKDMKQWDETVKTNREAETLDFKPKSRYRVNQEDLVAKFEATDDFEKEMAKLLEQAGNADRKAGEALEKKAQQLLEDDDLGYGDDNNNINKEEYIQRQAELAKLRSLMFYEEQKRHQMNKIKSKKYRKIRKKQVERTKQSELNALEQSDPQAFRELMEQEETKRMEERMTLSHRNTSKWARHQLARGKALDKDTRKALSEQIRIGDELKRKMKSMDNVESDGDDDDDLMEKAHLILQDTENAENDVPEGKHKGLFQMDFMKRGLKKQRERAKEEARQLLQELEDDNSSDDNNDCGSVSDAGEEKETKRPKKKLKAASKAETEKVLPKGKLVASQLEFSNSKATIVSGNIAIKLSNTTTTASKENQSSNQVHHHSESMTVEASSNDEDILKGNSINSSSSNNNNNNYVGINARKAQVFNKTEAIIKEDEPESSNPWLKGLKGKKGKTKKNEVEAISIAKAASLLDNNNDDGTKEKHKVEANNKVSMTVELSQEELVRRAFAAPSEADIEKEFRSEKADIEEEDEGRKKEEETVVKGWGSWTGAGAKPPKPPKKKLAKKLQAPKAKAKLKKRKDQYLEKVIISEKKAKKSAHLSIESVPYPYASKAQYERAMAGAIGRDWNTSTSVRNFTQPEVKTRSGIIINPISIKAKAKKSRIPARGPAKF